MAIDVDRIYRILSVEARNQRTLTYLGLSQSYAAATGEWHEPHGSWDAPLGELNQSLHDVSWPPLSAVVVLERTQRPGGLFWGSADSVPALQANEREDAYVAILNEVFAAPWPNEFPSEPPLSSEE